MILADEVYTRFYYGENGETRAPSFLDICEDDEQLLLANTFSKNWAMTGWRVGWLQAPKALGPAIERIVQVSSSGTPAFLQRGAIAAVEKGDDFVHQMVERCRAGRELVFQRLSGLPRVTIARPEAAFYNFFSVEGVTDTMARLTADREKMGPGFKPMWIGLHWPSQPFGA